MNQPIEMNPDGLRSAAAGFDDVAERLRQLNETVVNYTNNQGEAWGDDKFGRKFANGPKGYEAGRDNCFDALSKLADVLGQNATNLRDGATTFEQNEKSQSR